MFDTTYVSLYKYFGAPFGAILCGSAAFVDGLYHERRLFGGGLPASYFAAALALEGSRGIRGALRRAPWTRRACFSSGSTRCPASP